MVALVAVWTVVDERGVAVSLAASSALLRLLRGAWRQGELEARSPAVFGAGAWLLLWRGGGSRTSG